MQPAFETHSIQQKLMFNATQNIFQPSLVRMAVMLRCSSSIGHGPDKLLGAPVQPVRQNRRRQEQIELGERFVS